MTSAREKPARDAGRAQRRRSTGGSDRAAPRAAVGNLLVLQRDLALDLARISDLPLAARRILTAALEVGGADAGGVYLRDPATGDLILECHTGISAKFAASAARGSASSPRVQLISSGNPVYDVPLDEAIRQEGIRTVCALPVKHEEQILALINLAYRSRRVPSPGTRQALESIAAQLGSVLARVRALEHLSESELRFRTLFKSMPTPAYLWRRIGDDFVLCDHNDAAVAATNGHVLRILGSRARDYYQDRPDIVAQLEQCFASQGNLGTEMLYHFARWNGERVLDVIYSYAPPDTVLVYVDDITDRRRASEALQTANVQLAAERSELQNKNAALREILEHLERSRQQIAQQLTANVERIILPLLNRLRAQAGPGGEEYADHLQQALTDILAPFVNDLERRYVSLTPREVQICTLVRGGATSKDIARALGISEETVRTQRKGIRRKLGIAGRASNLESFLRLLDRRGGEEGRTERAPARVASS